MANGAGSRSDRVTIRDVAREASVGLGTASRVLSGNGASQEARAKVERAIALLGYRRNRPAGALRGSRTMTLGVLVPDLANPVLTQFLRGAEHSAGQSDYGLFVCDAQNSADVETTQLARLFEHRIDGLLLAGNLRSPRSLDPFTLADVPIEPSGAGAAPTKERARYVYERPAAEEAFEYLISLGHRRIAFLTRHAGRNASPRLYFLSDVLKKANLDLHKELVVAVRSAQECQRELQRLLSFTDPPTAIVVSTHVLIPAVVLALKRLGLSIPEDISVVGYGDSEWAQCMDPPLSVIDHDYYQEGRLLSERLIARIQGETPQPLPMLHDRFLIRSSIAPPRPQ